MALLVPVINAFRKVRPDLRPFARGGSVAIVAISVGHIIIAILLYRWKEVLDATNVDGILLAFRYLHLVKGIPGLQVWMYVATILALFGAFFRVGWIRIIVFLPQHALLGAMTWGGILAAYQGSYLDGTPMSWAHIFVDQIGYPILFIIHSSAILRRCKDPNG